MSLFIFAGLVFTAGQVWADGPHWEEIHHGVRLLEETREGPVNVWAVAVDVCADGVEIRATGEDEVRQRTSAFGRQVGAQVAINGGFYEPDYSPTGFAMGGGQVWSDDITAHGFIGFGEGGPNIWAPRKRIDEIPDGLSEAVGGYDSVAVAGEVPEFHQRFCGERHPRTVVGLSRDRETLYLGAVDGRSDESRGMTCEELGQWMIELGAWEALNLDGGGSTTLWMEDRGVVNQPSAGVERVVSNHLAVIADGQGAPSSCPREWVEEVVDDDEPGLVIEDVEIAPAVVEEVSNGGEREGGGRRCSAIGGGAAWWWIGLVLLVALRRSSPEIVAD